MLSFNIDFYNNYLKNIILSNHNVYDDICLIHTMYDHV